MGNGDSRTLFRDQVHQVLNTELSYGNSESWSGLFLFPENLEDILTMFPVSDVKVLLSRRPQNFQIITDKVLSTQALEILEVLKDSSDQEFPLAINAARFLIRVVPVTISSEFWWGRERRAQRLLNALVYYLLEQRSVTVDIQRLLLVTLCGQLCHIGLVRDPRADLWRWTLCSGTFSMTDTLFEKLLLTAMEPVTVAWWPYSHIRAEAAVSVREVNLLVLLALLDFQPFKVAQISEDSVVQTLIECGELLQRNAFADRLSTFEKNEWVRIASQGVRSALTNYAEARNSLLPGSALLLPFHAEMLILFYHLLTRNASFAESFSRIPTARDVLRPILELMYHSKNDGILGAGAVCMLRLCSYETFTSSLQVLFISRDPLPWPLFVGSYADLLVIGVSQLILENPVLVLREHLAGVLNNVYASTRSTSLRNLGTASGMQVALVLAGLSVKTWLFNSPAHYRPLELLLNFCRIQVGRSPEFTQIIASKSIVLDALAKMKAPICEPEPAEDLRWSANMLWLSRLKVALGVQELIEQLELTRMISVQPPVYEETKHIFALVSRGFWVIMETKQLALTEGTKKLLECPICLDFFTPPVFSCPNGHSICSICAERTTTCPECRAQFSSKLQNLAVERMLESLQMNCRYPGCHAVISLSKRRLHEESCEFNPSIECVVPDCTWVGRDLPVHLKTTHSAKEFVMQKAGGTRGWNSKTWKRADWGFGIWNFDGVVILNKSESTGEMFYLYMYDVDSKRHTLRLRVSCGRHEICFVVKTASARCISQFQTLPFHLSIKEIEQHFLEPAEGLEEGYKRLSISVEMID